MGRPRFGVCLLALALALPLAGSHAAESPAVVERCANVASPPVRLATQLAIKWFDAHLRH